MIRTITTLASVAIATASSTSAHAEPGKAFGARAPFVIGVDHLAGVTRQSEAPATVTVVGTSVGFLLPTLAPRLACHGFVTDNISVGGALSGGRSAGSAIALRSSASTRAGAVVPIDPHNAFWFRAGAGLTRVSNGDSNGVSAWVVGGEVLYVHTPVSHFGIMLGPMIETAVKVTSDGSVGRAASSSKWTIYGRTFGMLADL